MRLQQQGSSGAAASVSSTPGRQSSVVRLPAPSLHHSSFLSRILSRTPSERPRFKFRLVNDTENETDLLAPYADRSIASVKRRRRRRRRRRAPPLLLLLLLLPLPGGPRLGSASSALKRPRHLRDPTLLQVQRVTNEPTNGRF